MSIVIPPAALRATAVTALTSASLLLASPALAARRDDGDEPGEPLGTLNAILIFVVLPVAAFVVISVVVLATSSRGQRYRPGLGWWAGSTWFGAQPREGATGDGSRPDAAGASPAGEGRPATTDGGGARARW